MEREISTNIDVAITYGWNRVAYNALRSLSSRGLRVAVGDASKVAMARRSKYCCYSFSYPSFYKNPVGFVEYLILIFKSVKPSVYLPMHEEIFIIAKHLERFKDLGVKIPIHDFPTLKAAHKKDSLCDIARELDISIPNTFKPNGLSDLKSIWNEIGPRKMAVIKLLNSNSSKGVFYVTSYEELLRIYELLIEGNNFTVREYPLIQEYVKGDGYGVSMLFNHGKLRAKFTHKRLREKVSTGGTSTKRISVKNPILEEYSEYLLGFLRWHGIAMVEFKYNEKEKKAWLLEVNPRFWGSLALPIQAGVDFPYLLYKMAIDDDVEPVLDYKEGVVMRWILGDVLGTLDYVKTRRSLKPVIDFFSFKNEMFDDLHKDDLMPFFVECIYYLSKFARTLRLNPTEEALLDVDKI